MSTKVQPIKSSRNSGKPIVSRRFWYKKEVHSCVLCGREKIYKERVYDEKLKGVEWIDYACPEHFM